MASVGFFLRGNIKDKPLSIWVRFKDKNIDISLSMKELKCPLEEWKNGKCKNGNKKMFDSDLESINTKLSKIESYILQDYNNLNSTIDHKTWLRICIDSVLNPKEKSSYSSNIIEFIDTYLELKKNAFSERTIKKIRVLKNTLIDFCTFNQKPPMILFKDLDNYFKDRFEQYCLGIDYKISTINGKLKDAKAIANFAENYNIEIHPHIKDWKLGLSKYKSEKPKKIYLNFDELNSIKNIELLQEDLDIARDWLIIACFTGQRVSDFLRFEKSMISEDGNVRFIVFQQEKTRKLMQIPILKEVEEILNKRKGEFPPKISDITLNQDIKIVCKYAKISEKVKGSLSIVQENGKRRGVIDDYPKYKLVTSHIGRRSFATNFHTLVPTPDIMYVTGHSTEKIFLEYIGKTENEIAKRTANSFTRIGH